MTLSRRRLLTSTLGAAAAAAAVVACRGDDDGASPSTTAGATSSTSPSTRADPVPTSIAETIPASGFPRTVGRGFAVATIERRPERIVATADRDQLDVLLAIGISPVLYGRSGDYDPVAPWLDAAAVGALDAADMPGAFEPNLERIAAARPDLIVDAWAEESLHGSLSRIAPTIQIKLDNTDSWQAAQRLAGEATGQEEAAAAAIADTETVLAEQTARLAALAGQSVAVAFIEGAELVMIPGNEIGGRIFTELGLTVQPTPDGVSGRHSMEQVGELLGDASVIVSFDTVVGDEEASALFAQLPAVVADRWVRIDAPTASACYQESSLSVRWAAPRLADALLA